MTDRELLELAARAAGYELDFDHDPWHRAMIVNNGVVGSIWNPLDDDGDALRLAVKLGFRLQMVTSIKAAMLSANPYSATRLAIVKAAAEIGKGIK